MKSIFRVYRGVVIPNCPRGCFEKFIDREITEHTVGGIEPKFMCGGGAMEGWRIKRYSIRLKRHSHHALDSWRPPMNYCSVCGSMLKVTEMGAGA